MRLPRPSTVAVIGGVVTTAVAGGLGTDVSSTWYRTLTKPDWQPPGEVFGPVWTGVYTLIGTAGSRVIARAAEDQRRSFEVALAANLALNTGWSWLFFTAKKPTWALVEILVLELSTLDLMRRAAAVDTTSAALLTPYAGWVGFATVLTAELARLNPGD